MFWKPSSVSFCIFLFVFGIANEPSAFERQSGATKKDIKSLKDSSLNLSSIILDLQGRIETLEQVQHGLQSFYDAQNQKIQKNLLDLENFSMRSEEMRSHLDILKDEVRGITERQERLQKEQERLIGLLSEIEKKIRDISIVSSSLNELVVKEFEKTQNEIKKQAEVIVVNQGNIQKLSLELEKFYTEKKKDQEKNAFKYYEKKSDILKEAKKMYKNQQYSEAQMRFSWLVDQNYQKAEASYFLGQIAFIQKRYEDAIFYYRTSATLDDKKEYMPLLLLNTIKSFQALKDNKNALKFADSLLVLYPKSKEAEIAKKIQTSLKGEKKNGKK